MLNAQTRSANHPQVQRRCRTQTACPNADGSAHVKDERPTPRPQISLCTFRRRLPKLGLRLNAPVLQQAQQLAGRFGVDPVELLHMAICRAAKPEASRPDIDLLPYLTMLMRSIGSGIAKARRRAAERGSVVPLDYVHEQVPSLRSIMDPVSTIERAREQRHFAELIEELHGGDPVLAKLVDAIGMNLRGGRIQKELGLGLTELASIRRRLKRRAVHLMAREGLRMAR